MWIKSPPTPGFNCDHDSNGKSTGRCLVDNNMLCRCIIEFANGSKNPVFLWGVFGAPSTKGLETYLNNLCAEFGKTFNGGF